MGSFRINDEEREALRGLPHLARLVYLLALRPFMDYRTGIVGLARAISWISLAEETEVWSVRGIKREKPSKGQLERSVEWLVKRKLITWDKRTNQAKGRLVFSCPLATADNCASKKAIRKPYESHTDSHTESRTSDEPEKQNDHKHIHDTGNQNPDGKSDVFVSDPPRKPYHIRDPVTGKEKTTPLPPLGGMWCCRIGLMQKSGKTSWSIESR